MFMQFMETQQQHMQTQQQFMQAQQQQMQIQQASISNLENQLGQLANALRNKPPGKLPIDMQVDRQEDIRECKAIELRSGKEEPDLYKNKTPEEEK